MKSLFSLAAAAVMLAAIPSAPVLAANPDSWPSCLGQECCDLIRELPISERSAFRAQHAYCLRDDKDERKYLPSVVSSVV